jgi:methylglyoxal reductase
MLTTKIGNLETSRIALGTWAIGGGAWWGDNDDEMSVQSIRAAVDGGITLIDTAPAYGFGHSEEIVGKAVKGIRDKVQLSTKAGLVWDPPEGAFFFESDGVSVYRNLSKKSIKRVAEECMQRLGTDYLDVFFTHWPSLPEFPTPVSETMEALLELKQEGKILAIGVSNTSPENLSEYLKYGKVDLVQEKFSIITRSNWETLKDILDANDIVFQTYSPLESGLLTGRIGRDFVAPAGSAREFNAWYAQDSLPKVIDMIEKWQPLCEKYDATTGQLALAWIVSLGDKFSVLTGARTVEQIESNLKGGAIELAEEDKDFMTKTADEAIAAAAAES